MEQNDNNLFLGTGWAFPVQFDPVTSTVKLVSAEEDIKSSLEILFLTELGERVMLPEYGGSLRNFLFEPLDLSMKSYLEEVIRTSIINFEPRINLDTIEIQQYPEEGKMEILLTYYVKAINSRDNFVFPYYLTESSNKK